MTKQKQHQTTTTAASGLAAELHSLDARRRELTAKGLEACGGDARRWTAHLVALRPHADEAARELAVRDAIGGFGLVEPHMLEIPTAERVRLLLAGEYRALEVARRPDPAIAERRRRAFERSRLDLLRWTLFDGADDVLRQLARYLSGERARVLGVLARAALNDEIPASIPERTAGSSSCTIEAHLVDADRDALLELCDKVDASPLSVAHWLLAQPIEKLESTVRASRARGASRAAAEAASP